MKLRVLLYILLFLLTIPASYAGERARLSLSLTPSLHGGVFGIKDESRSPLAYNGPLASASLRISTRRKAVDFYFDASYSFGWLGNNYGRDSKSTVNNLIDLSIGGITCIYDNNIASVKAGCAFGGFRDVFDNQRIDRCLHALTIDANASVSAELKLPRRFSIVLEERIPFLAFIVTFNKSDLPLLDSDYIFKALPGNDVKVGVCRQLKDGRSMMLVMRHYCYSSGSALPNSFQLQSFELGLAFRFGLAVF